ncbi:MAG: hypothetical protein M0Z42_26050 [Actinomycetota bacterium]|nr:hypothetical protein [Actinomycetota bacterium]
MAENELVNDVAETPPVAPLPGADVPEGDVPEADVPEGEPEAEVPAPEVPLVVDGALLPQPAAASVPARISAVRAPVVLVRNVPPVG